MLLILLGVFGNEIQIAGTGLAGWVALLSFIVVGYIFGRAAGWFTYLPNWLYWLDNPDTQALMVILLVFGTLIWFVTKEPGKNNQKAGAINKLMDNFGKIFQK